MRFRRAQTDSRGAWFAIPKRPVLGAAEINARQRPLLLACGYKVVPWLENVVDGYNLEIIERSTP